jgi:hypothetical protein
MTARFSVKNRHIEDALILVFKKQTPTVKVITVRLTFGLLYQGTMGHLFITTRCWRLYIHCSFLPSSSSLPSFLASPKQKKGAGERDEGRKGRKENQKEKRKKKTKRGGRRRAAGRKEKN